MAIFIGNNDANILTGGILDDTLIGLGGNDTLDGGFGIDAMIGGAGDDFYFVRNLGDVVAEAAGEGVDTVQSSISYTLTADVENLTLLGIADINATGNNLNNIIVGSFGANVIDGGLGADSMAGGLGNDTYVVDNAGDFVNELFNSGVDTVRSSISFTLGANLENLNLSGDANINGTGNALSNNMTGNNGNNVIDGGAGADMMSGALGNDTYIVDNTGDVVLEFNLPAPFPSGGLDTVLSSVTYTLSANVENLTLTGAAAINGTGNSSNNLIVGNGAANLINGGAGIDTMNGGGGNDTYVVDNAGDVVTETATGGLDTVQSSVTHTLAANVENLTLTGLGAINGTGNALNNTITGNFAGNVINGGVGADTMNGGLGSDTYVVDNAGDVVIEAPLIGGTDTVQSSVTHTLAANVENLTLTGIAEIDGAGNDAGNTIFGNFGANTLNGRGGNDVINGGIGSDVLNGGLGADSLTGGGLPIFNFDTFVFDTALGGSNVDTITDFDATTDTIRLDDDIFTALAPGPLPTGAFNANFIGVATQPDDRIVYNTFSGALFFDPDGSGAAAATQFATLTGAPAISAADFIVVA